MAMRMGWNKGTIGGRKKNSWVGQFQILRFPFRGGGGAFLRNTSPPIETPFLHQPILFFEVYVHDIINNILWICP